MKEAVEWSEWDRFDAWDYCNVWIKWIFL